MEYERYTTVQKMIGAVEGWKIQTISCYNHALHLAARKDSPRIAELILVPCGAIYGVVKVERGQLLPIPRISEIPHGVIYIG